MKMILEVTSSLAIVFLCMTQVSIHANDFPVRVEQDAPMKTRDGVTLRSDIYRPGISGRFPVLLQRNPYNKDRWPSGSWPSHSPLGIASHGYVVIIQDTRGRYASEGEFYPFMFEIEDGYDAVEWAAALPYSNGRVCMYGSSYVGATQWLAALGQPPHLTAVFPLMTSSDYYQGWIYRGGALELLFSGFWTNALALNTLSRQASKRLEIPRWVQTLPLADYPVMSTTDVTTLAPYFRDWLDHESDGKYWRRWSIEKNYATLKVPAYHTGGWYDIFLEGTLKNYEKLSKLYPKTPHFLTVGPWTHNTPSDRKYGELDFGAAAPFDPDQELIAWADLTLKGAANPLVNRAPVKIFVMGENAWREEREWPLRRGLLRNYYLHAGRSAKSLSGDGLLTESIPEEGRYDEFAYDPRNPVPTTGGPLCCLAEQESGPFDQNKVETRLDVLVYSTPPLPEPIEVTGPVRVVLYVGSDSPDTDFTAKLVDVYPDGKAYNLTDGILRMRHRNSLDVISRPIEKDQIYRIEVDLIATSNLFQKGHHIRLEISSSNFPRFDRNLNTGTPLITGYQTQLAHNRVFQGKSHPSALIVPVIPRKSIH